MASGDVGYRKPAPEIYRVLLERIGTAPERVWFVDDRPQNPSAARALGIRTVCLRPKGPEAADHTTVGTLEAVLAVLDGER